MASYHLINLGEVCLPYYRGYNIFSTFTGATKLKPGNVKCVSGSSVEKQKKTP